MFYQWKLAFITVQKNLFRWKSEIAPMSCIFKIKQCFKYYVSGVEKLYMIFYKIDVEISPRYFD